MNALSKTTTNNIIDFRKIKDEFSKQKVELNTNENVDQRRCNKVAGVSSEVYAFTTQEEIKAMIDVFDKHIKEAPDNDKLWIAQRNKMLFIIGINLGIRASDLCELKYNFFIKEDGTFKEHYSLQPKKTKKTKKYVKLFFNEAVKQAIINYIEECSIDDMNGYLFKSREGDSHITTIHLGRIIKTAAAEAGIDKNICSHTLRKTFGYWAYHNAQDKNNALIILQKIYNHSSPAMTSKYIGLTDDEMSDVFNELNLGIDFI